MGNFKMIDLAVVELAQAQKSDQKEIKQLCALTWIVSVLTNDLKFMCIEFGQFMMNGYEDMNDNVKSQNGAQMTSWLSDQAEQVGRSIPNHGQDPVKIST